MSDDPKYKTEAKTYPILHVVRNPYGFDDETTRGCRLALCDLYETTHKKLEQAESVLRKDGWQCYQSLYEKGHELETLQTQHTEMLALLREWLEPDMNTIPKIEALIQKIETEKGDEDGK